MGYGDGWAQPEYRYSEYPYLEPATLSNFTRTPFYAASLPVEGIRDLAGDEVNEFEHILERELKRMYWNQNDDGMYDSREFAGADGTLVRGFAIAVNGAYELSSSREASQ